MTLAKRIIPCMDVTAGRVVKGINFLELRDAGDPVEIARRYDEQGADELTFLDITATSDERDLILHIIEAVASQVFIPLTVGGGVRVVDDVRRLLNAGADKVSINTSAITNPQLVADAAASATSCGLVMAEVLMLTLSAPAFNSRRTSSTTRTPPPTVSGMKTCEATASIICRIRSRSSEVAVMSRKVSSSAPCSS